ncbi:hypothetical protein EIP91_001199 [Steccherinum ochraceum]|uniref:BRCT domain-containing protein n=1 Tax=Steccherinum ochraceum TaxID=92696 RepID=A0A4R0RQ69_9APHY|nr:hypothetical protein EIP91_001199 [Steccherinum ochraceum]
MSYRRGNKSHKVPNVKLRPAIPASSASSAASRGHANQFRRKDSGFDSEEEDNGPDMSLTFSTDACPRPFKGVLLCATGINDKTTIFKQAIELGALSSSDLTDKVTHVIAEEPGSAKYKCALENGIPIMHPSWIIESYKIWLKGDDVDLAESVKQHRLPILNGVVVTLTGAPAVHHRTEVNKLVTQNGGTYVKSLERPIKVTHLICFSESTGEEGARGPWTSDLSEKMMYAKKFNERGEANIRMVWEEWLWDCLAHNGRFDEEEYLVSKPRPQRKKSPQAASGSDNTSLPMENQMEPSSSNPHPGPASPRGHKASIHATEEEEEVASVKRAPDVNKIRIWETIMGSRGFEVAGGKLIRSPSKSQAARQSLPPVRRPVDEEESLSSNAVHKGKGKRPAANGSLLASFRRSKSFAPATKDASTPKNGRQPFQRVATAGASSSEDAFWGVPNGEVGEVLAQGGEELPIASGSRTPGSAVARESSFMVAGSSRQKADVVPKTNIFAGSTFQALGEARCASVKTAVEESGGSLVDDLDAEVDFIIVRLVSGSKLFREEADDTLRGKYRTECWLERCMYEERICAPEEHIAFVPLGIETPVPGAEDVNLSFSGLDQSEGFWIRRLARALGLSLAPNFSRRTTHLLCPSMTGAKFDKAVEWGIPVVDLGWMERLAKEGLVPPVEIDGGHPSYRSEPSSPRVAADPLPERDPVDRKGKGKANDADVANNAPLPLLNDPPDKRPPSRSPGHRPQRKDSVDDFFGEPGALLANDIPSSPLFEDPATSPPRSRASTADPHRTPSRRGSNDHQALSHQPTLQELREDMLQTRIPSSNSPSPVKPPSGGAAAKRGPVFGHSPLRISKEASKVLEESITSLLGKRHPSEEDLHGRGGKRARPLIRTKSKQNQQAAPNPAPPPPPVHLDHFDAYGLGEEGEEDISMLVGEGPGSDHQSMHVTYEDPNQNDERKRLMRLLETHKKEIWEVEDDEHAVVSQPKAGGSKKRTLKEPTRRSSRVAGF